MAAILNGKVALLPEGAWQQAEQALAVISIKEHAAYQVGLARQGRLV